MSILRDILLSFLLLSAFASNCVFAEDEEFLDKSDINITVAFPHERQRLPFCERVYFIGATDASRGEILYVNGATTAVHKTGAFISMVDVKVGTNNIVVFQGRSKITRSFVVSQKQDVEKEPFKLIENSEDPRLLPASTWRTKGNLFQNRIMSTPDGIDTVFFLPDNFLVRGSEIKGLSGVIAVWVEGRLGYMRKSLLKKEQGIPLPSYDVVVPDPTIGFSSAPPYGKKPEDVCIFIDAGHGGKESGAISPHGWKEKEVNLLQAQAIKKELELAGFNVVMTREGDETLGLLDRVMMAYSQKADAFISVHHNATAAHRDPREVRHTTSYASLSNGFHLAKCIQKYIGPSLVPIKDNGAQMKSLAVCRNPAVPSCLIEVDFINLPDGEAESWDLSRHKKVARAVVCGVLDWMMNEAHDKKSEETSSK
ncbi:MAG: N-acetylmuramoyl-L-alanine amidase [Kiritimatiellae bacterium]|nr:N-acetylmuramoyl-L-alanine amidase [Kiritimatiellia bacterium]